MTVAATARFQNQRLDEIVRRDRETAASTLEQETEIARALQEELVHWHDQWRMMATESVEDVRAKARRIVALNEQESWIAMQEAAVCTQEEEVQCHTARCAGEASKAECIASQSEMQ